MNFLQSVVGRITGQPANELATIEGKFYLLRLAGVRSSGKECIYLDCLASIRRTPHDYQSELVVTRLWNEAEQDLLEEEDENAEERGFLIDERINFAVDASTPAELQDEEADASATTLTWDSADDTEAYYAFVCDKKAKPESIRTFEYHMHRAMYERKFNKPASTASQLDLDAFKRKARSRSAKADFTTHRPSASPPKQEKPLFRPPSPDSEPDQSQSDDEIADQLTSRVDKLGLGSTRTAVNTPPRASTSTSYRQFSPEAEEHNSVDTSRDLSYLDPVSVPAQPKELVLSQSVELYLYDTATAMFMSQAKNVDASVWTVTNKDHPLWLTVIESEGTSKERVWVSLPLDGSLNMNFSEAQQCVTFPFQHEDTGRCYTWLIRCANRSDYNELNMTVSRCMFEADSGNKFDKLTPAEQTYAQQMYAQNDVDMSEPDDDQYYDTDDDEKDSHPQESEGADEEEVDTSYEAPDSEDEEPTKSKGKGRNSQMAVGYKEDLSFVVRGNMIGVFRTGSRGSKKLKFVANVTNLTTPDGKRSIAPSKIMLHQQDSNMILRDPMNPASLYQLDLETGKVVEEYKVGLDVVNFLPDTKFAPTTTQSTFTGHSSNALFRIDPRLSGSKLVDSQYKQYVGKNQFSAAATTENGAIAIASEKGDIRLFDTIGKNAKTALPAFGQPISGLDVSKDGRWVVATTDTFLLLIDTTIQEGRYAGSSGFDRSFPATAKPKPKRLTLRPEHAAYMQGKLKFTPAKFNTGPDSVEKTIVTSSGPFVIAFNFRRVQQGYLDSYTIRRYDEQVVADSFRFNDNKDIFIALENNLLMEQKGNLQAPTRQSLGGAGIVKQW